MYKFAFIGGTERGFRLIEALIQKNIFPSFAVILKEDEHELDKYSVKIKKILNEKKIPNSIKKKLAESDYKKIMELKPDFIFVFGWRTIIDMEINKYLKFGLIASHHSLLPKYRGFAPVQWAIINGEVETGVTLFLLNEGEIDSGKIISQKKSQIFPSDNFNDVDKKLTGLSVKLFLKFVEDYGKNEIHFSEQNESEATYTCKRIPEDGKIDWNKSSGEIYNLIRALVYGAYCFYKDEKYFIRKVLTDKNNNEKKYAGIIPGRVIKTNSDGIEVLCGKGTIIISEWENGKTGIINCPADIVKSLSATLK